MTTNHPNDGVLSRFSRGDLEDKISAVVAAHLGSCSQCQTRVSQLESKLADLYFEGLEEQVSTKSSTPFDIMQEEILKKPQVKTLPIVKPNEFVEVSGKKIELPAHISHLTKSMRPWRKVGSRIQYSQLDIHGNNHLYFVHFNSGAQIPEHTHLGQEFVYVIEGSFSDQISEYSTGDFACFSQEDHHSPKTDDPDGCLLLVSLEAPFVFKKGWSQLLNPISRFLLKY